MMDGILGFLDEVFLPYLIGGILPGIVVAIVSYWIVGPIVAAYQLRRRKKLAKRAEMARAALDAEQAAYRAEADNV